MIGICYCIVSLKKVHFKEGRSAWSGRQTDDETGNQSLHICQMLDIVQAGPSKPKLIKSGSRNPRQRSPPIGGAGQNAAPLNFTISADIRSNSLSLLVILRQTVTELCASMLPTPVSRTFMQIGFCNRPETDSDVISGTFVGPIFPDKPVKFCDPYLNRSREIPPEAIGGDIFDSFSLTVTSYSVQL